MFTDERKVNAWERIRQRGLSQFAHRLPESLLRKAASHAGVQLGQGALNLLTLTWLSLSSAFHTGHNFANVLSLVVKLLQDMGQSTLFPPRSGTRQRRGKRPYRPHKATSRRKAGPKKSRSRHDPRGNGESLSEEAFTQARRKMPLGFWMSLILLLGEAFQQEHDDLIRYENLRLLALDGTCVNLPLWKRLRDHFGVARNGGKARRAQARMVMLQLPRVRIPLCYELTPKKQGERTVAARLLQRAGRDDLVLMDKGFFSYGLFCQIHRQNAFFAVRLMRGTAFKTIRRLDKKDRLVQWTPSDRKWKKQDLPSNLVLRVIEYQVKGFRPSALVTNLTDPHRLSRDKWLGLAASEAGKLLDEGVYHQRWQIETTFCELKVRQGMEKSLRGRTPQTIQYEVAGHVVLYLLVRWLMVEAATQIGEHPLRLSFVNALLELKDIAPALLTAKPQRVRQILLPRLLQRIASHRVPVRPGRHYPRRHDGKVRNKGAGKRALPSKIKCQEA
jgi:hypothetical protein